MPVWPFVQAKNADFDTAFEPGPCYRTEVVYHLQKMSGNSHLNANGTRHFTSFQQKISGEEEILKGNPIFPVGSFRN